MPSVPLSAGAYGDNVAQLHDMLRQQGFQLPASEVDRRFFGPATRRAVQAVQQRHGLPVSGAIDEPTSAALATALVGPLAGSVAQVPPTRAVTDGAKEPPVRPADNHGSQGDIYTVTGTVTSPDRAGVGGLQVQVVDKQAGPDALLATATTDALGHYAVDFEISPSFLVERRKTRPDLQARVSIGTRFLAASSVCYNASQRETLNILLPANATALPSEHETLMAALTAQYSGPLGELQENAERSDITYLANKTGWDARAVALASLADQFSQITVSTPSTAHTATVPQAALAGPSPSETHPTAAVPPMTTAPPVGPIAPIVPAPPVVPTPPVALPTPVPTSIKPAFYYALFRAGLPADANSLFRATSRSVEAIWQHAISQGVIPQSLVSEMPGAIQTFQTLAAAQLLNAPAMIGISTLSQMLTNRLPSTSDQEAFAQLYTQFSDDPAKLWSAVQGRFGAKVANQLQFDGQLYYLSLNNATLVTALHAAESKTAGDLTSPVDLAARGYYDASKWTPLIGTSVPPQIPGSDATEKAANYAELLAAQVRLSFPTAVAGDQVKRGVFPVSDTPAVATAVHSFLTTNYNTFAIGAEPVEAFIARNKINGTPPAVIAQVKRLQRVYQLTGDDQTMSVLLQHKLDSAFAITRYDSAGFLRAFADKLGEQKAVDTYARAKHVYSSVMNVAINYIIARQAPGLGGYMWPSPSPPPAPTYPIIAYPTLESLFGSLDYCSCKDCQSILSPAAYLVDLLHYLDQPAPTAGYQNPQAVLFQRRPDLQYLPLTCENTNTALPYIDIVNETLEYVVANAPPRSKNQSLAALLASINGFQGYSTDNTVTSADLLANPQFVNDGAYAVLQTAFFPPPLPFNRPLEQLRQLFQNMSLSLPDVMAALRTDSATDINLTGTAYNWGDVLIEQLGISRDEHRIFADPGLTLADLYGYPAASDALKTLQSITLQDFSRRTGVAYSDVVSLLRTQFINPNAVLIERLERLGVPFATLQTLKTTPSTAAAFKAGLPAGLDARAYGGATPTDFDAVVTWVVDPTNFARIMSIVTLTNPGNADQCSGTSFAFAHSDGSVLTATEFLKLIRFIRLWQKLGLTIEQTDDILSALYPLADLPTDSDDKANRTLLDDGFKVVLLRIGELFRIMNNLSLTPKNSLGALLACWAPIGTVGPNALYQQMFGGPTLQREDPGAPIATIGGAPNAGDVLTTTINSVPITLTIGAGDTIANIAANLAATINATATTDPTTALPLNSRIFASVQTNSNVVIIRAGCTLTCGVSVGSTETFTAAAPSPLSQSATVAGTVTPGDTLTATVNTIPIAYRVQAGDTIATIAANLANAVNITTSPDPYSGLPLNSLLVASSSADTVTIDSVNSGAPLALACSYDSSASAGSYTTGPLTPAFQTATVGGAITAGDQLTTTINGLAIPYTVTAADTSLAALAGHIGANINSTTAPDPVSGMALNRILHASSAGAVITIAADDPATVLDITCGATGSESYTQAGPFPTSEIATVTGNFVPGVILTTTINAVVVTYIAVGGDTAATIAANIAKAVNADTTIDPLTNVALNQLVSAAATGNAITITTIGNTGSFTLTAAFSTGTYTAGIQPPPFADDGYGNILSDPTQTIFGHEPVLRAAFHLTGAEFSLIANSLHFTLSTRLTLASISSIFRVGWLAHALGMSVVEFLLLRQMTGLDPFAPLDPLSGPDADPPVVRFIELVQAMSTVGLRPVQALYLLWDQDISGKSSPTIANITGLALALRAAFATVAAQFTIQTDPDGSIATGLMALVYGNTATDFFFGLLDGTLVSAIAYPNPTYPNPQPPPPQPVIDASGGALSYDDLRKQLSFAGVLDAKTQASIDSAITANGIVPALHSALRDLATANQQLVGPFFAAYPELQPLYSAFVASTDPPQQKRTTLLANFLPDLIQKRNQEQALATVTAATGSDPSFATALLDDATILHSAADATAPIVNDVTAQNNPGLAAEIFLSNDLSATPDMVLDAEAAAYAPSNLAPQQFATLSGKVMTGDIVTTTINGVAIPYTALAADKTAADIAAKIAAAINAAVTPDPFSGLPLHDVVTATANGAVISVKSNNSGAGVSVSCSATLAPAATYTAGAQVPASQIATLAGTITAGDVITTTINTIAIPYTVFAGDTSIAILAAHVAAAINAMATVDPSSGQPLNQVISAVSAAGVITITAATFGPNFSLSCSVSTGATETYAPNAQTPASQSATLSALLPANDVVITTINSVAVAYTVVPGDVTLAGLAANIAAQINATTTVDSTTGKPLNGIVAATSGGGVITINSINPGLPFTLSCSVTVGAYTLDSQAPVWQSALVSGGITVGDILTTTINGIAVPYTVTGADTSISILAGHIAGAVNATVALATVVTASNIGGVVAFKSVGFGTAFTLACSVSANATELYSTGPQFPAWQATISGGFAPGDSLTTNINGASVTYALVPTDTTPATIAANVATAINASTVLDPTTGLPVNQLVIASSSADVITWRSAGPAFTMSCSLSVGAIENYVITGELPARPGGGAIAGSWSGYLNAPQDGFYNIKVETDPGAQVTLLVAGQPVSMAASSNGSIWANQGPISLTAGKLVPFELTATTLRGSLALNWQTTGIGWQAIPANYLYSDILIDRLQTAYVRFLKATSLATSLSLLADEIAFLGTSTRYQVNTTSKDKLAPGVVTFTPASMANIQTGSVLVVDSGPAQEVISVTAATPTTFQATIVNPHDGTNSPFPIVDHPEAATGKGWLNFLPVAQVAGSPTAALVPPPSYTAGPLVPASQTATVAGTIKIGDVLTTTVNTIAIPFTVTAGDTTIAVLAGHIAAAINGTSTLMNGVPLNQTVSASNSGGVITIKAAAFGPAVTVTCSVSGGATETYTAGAQVAASQTAMITGSIPVNDLVITTINTVAIQYKVIAADSDPASLASHIAAAINATTTVDSVTQRPLNALVSASNTGGVITIGALSPSIAFTLGCSVAGLRKVLKDVLDFARIKAAVSPNNDQLLQVLENPNLLSSDGVTPQLVKLTGWSPSSLYALLQHFFGSTQLSSLGPIDNLTVIYDAFALVTTSRLSAAALLAGTTNAPTPATVAALQSALRSLYADSDWRNVIKPVSDALRIKQRDALVAYILQQFGDAYMQTLTTLTTTADAAAGATQLTFASTAGIVDGTGIRAYNVPPNTIVQAVGAGTVTLSAPLSAGLPSVSNVEFIPTTSVNISTADNLFEFFLMDVETQPPVETSRIRLALSSVQLFIERVLRNLEPQVMATDIDGSLWDWMKRYRVWQANREVFLWPENWLYPELRDDQSPFFQQMMASLLQSDITDDAAASAYLDYLSSLESVAKLEPCGLFYAPATGDSDEASYVVARTAGAHRKHYFRQLLYGSWTPWTEIKIDCEDMPVTPIVWNGRLMLFWLKVTKSVTPRSAPSGAALASGSHSSDNINSMSLDDIQNYGQAGVGQQKKSNVTVSAVLCWSEYYNGKWQPQKSSDVNRPTLLGTYDTDGPNSFDVDRNLLQITPTSIPTTIQLFLQNALPPDALLLAITGPSSSGGGFVVYNTHSLPVRWDDVSLQFDLVGLEVFPLPLSSCVRPSDPGRTLQPALPYTGGDTSQNFNISYWTSTDGSPSTTYQNNLLGLISIPRTVDCAPTTDGWDAPFFFEDRRNVFYVTTTENWTLFINYEYYGLVASTYINPSINVPPLVVDVPPVIPQPPPFVTGIVTGGGDPAAIVRHAAQQGNIRIAVGSGMPVTYQGTTLYPTGQFIGLVQVRPGVSAFKPST